MKWFRTSCTLSLINESDKWWSDAEQALDDNIPISLTNESDKWWVIQHIINKWKWKVMKWYKTSLLTNYH